MRQLATIQTIKKLRPIEGADRIEVATVKGWNLVVKKGEFKEGDLCIYFEVDSLLPKLPQFEFLAKSGTKKMLVDGKEIEGYRLKTVRLRGQISQGLALPVASFPDKLKIQYIWEEGTDVTEHLGVVKYEPPISASLAGTVKGQFPSFIPKTDEERIQNCDYVLNEYKDTKFYVTEKIDGSSMTVYHKDGELNVCSRNLNLKETEGNTLWRVAREMGLDGLLENTPYVLQGEIYGEGIQKNPLKIKGHKFAVFNVYDYVKGEYLSYDEMIKFTNSIGVETVPLVEKDASLFRTVDEMVDWATRKSAINPDVWVEGLVFRPMKEIHDEDLGRLSFKVINPEFLLKYEN